MWVPAGRTSNSFPNLAWLPPFQGLPGRLQGWPSFGFNLMISLSLSLSPSESVRPDPPPHLPPLSRIFHPVGWLFRANFAPCSPHQQAQSAQVLPIQKRTLYLSSNRFLWENYINYPIVCTAIPASVGLRVLINPSLPPGRWLSVTFGHLTSRRPGSAASNL